MVNRKPVSFNSIKSFVEDNYKLVFAAAGCCVAAGIGIYFFIEHQNRQQEHAQLAFAQTIVEVRQARKDATGWTDVDLAAKTAYRSYKNSALAPYFLALESQALVAQGNIKQALEPLEQAITAMGKNSPFYFVFKIRDALNKLDNDDITVQTTGLNELQALAQDKTNNQRDQALYYLGEYYTNHDDAARAQEVWRELLDLYPGTTDSDISPWAMLAHEKIQ